MRNEKISWWYFVLVVGLLVPLSGYIFYRHCVLLPYFNPSFIEGMNPCLASIFNGIIAVFICTLFKLIYKLYLPGRAFLILYIVLSAVVIFSLLYYQFFYTIPYPQGIYTRHYIDLEPIRKISGSRVVILKGLQILDICFFVFLTFINFPKRRNLAGT